MSVVTVLVGKKSDLKDVREVPVEEGTALAEAQNLGFIETSALDSTNVQLAFQTLVKEIYNVLSRKVVYYHEQKPDAKLGSGKTVILEEADIEGKPARRFSCCSG
uniref:Uncharacterized protein n=1 Tax=Araucaria cunninghamii TaxID=56994 RepID=A0A0D6QSN5_ARACU